MYSIDYQKKLNLGPHSSGRPTVPIVFAQKRGNSWKQLNNDAILCDTGAVVTSLNKEIAEENHYPIVKHGTPVVFGYNDLAYAKKGLLKCGMTEEEAEAYLNRFRNGKGQDLVNSLRDDYEITDVGLVCDTRKVSLVMLSDFIVEDVIIATPRDDGVLITEVLGMNVLEKFHIGFDYSGNYLLLSERIDGRPLGNPEFRCGNVSSSRQLFQQ
ncbi:MAG: hypothetical protein LBI54_01770 [Lachnospiraceae bacterium]|jgi:hypothetical protein|nr:hypothetical protein [Lachnospiraceae bacterium]